ncbi:hypothetical protein [Halobacterium wangiae]|uniref:hypothetical protein n=1 Tax=Halobacterium wangiae TaxID=2902623 RepID=UPI001E37F36C|nr:hypothetical protein [Halobacterium wangiae]
MVDAYRELGFDVLLATASGFALTAYMLGVLLDPLPAAAVSFILVIGGVMTLVPPQARATAVAIGCVAVGLAGVVIPRTVNSFLPVPVGNELLITLTGSGLVLLLTFALLRLTVFDNTDRTPA